LIWLFWAARLASCDIVSDAIELDENRKLTILRYYSNGRLNYYPLSRYGKYPLSVRWLIRKADIEDGQCRGIFDKYTLYACNRREVIMFELEKRGWCYGGSLVGFEMHWLKCADDPYHRPGGHGPDALYTKEEIEEMTEYLDQ